MTEEKLELANSLASEIEKIKNYILAIKETFNIVFYPDRNSPPLKLQNVITSGDDLQKIFDEAQAKVLNYYETKLRELEEKFNAL